MSVGSVGSSGPSLNSLFQAFKSGTATISKDQLEQVQGATGGAKSPISSLVNNFDKIDTNGNGISFDELMTYAKSYAASALGANPPAGSPPGPKPMTKDELSAFATKLESTDPTAANGINQVVQNFSTADTNGDGELSAEEFQAFAQSNGISIPHSHHHQHGQSGSTTASANGQSNAGTSQGMMSTGVAGANSDTEGSGGGEDSSALSALIQGILQKYRSGADTDVSTLLTGVEA